MRVFFVIAFLFCVFFSNAQEPTYAIKNNEVFIVHIVEGGQTVYKLHLIYDVPVDEIYEVNQSSENGLQIGQRILIPTNLTPDKVAQNVDKKEALKLCEHIVKRKETLFGISRQYEQSVAELLELNPEVEDGLKVGQVIKVRCKKEAGDVLPVAEDENHDRIEPKQVPEQEYLDTLAVSEQDTLTIAKDPVFEDSIVTYTVQQGETLYAISRRFMVHVDTLARVNDIKGYNISPGEKLLIPLKIERIEPVVIKSIVLDKPMVDTLLNLFEPVGKKELYHITFLLPFKIEDNGQILEGLADHNTRLNRVSDIALDFYLGVKLALDSLENLGLKAKINVFDTEGNVEVMEALLNRTELIESDLIIGPFFPKTIEKAAAWAKVHQKQLFVPVGVSTEVLKNNPFMVSSIPSELTLYAGMASYIVENYSTANIVIAEGNNIIERDRIDFFTTQLTHYATQQGKTIPFTITALGSGTGRDMARKFQLDSTNVFISLATDDQNVVRFVNTLNAAKNQTSRHSNTPVIVFGSKEWLEINSLSSYYKNRFNLHVPMSNYIDYERAAIKMLVEHVQENLNIDPSRFLLQGFDLTFYAIRSNLMRTDVAPGYMNDFFMTKIGSGHGVENQTTFIVSQENFELVKKSVVKNKVVLLPKEEAQQQAAEQAEDTENEGED